MRKLMILLAAAGASPVAFAAPAMAQSTVNTAVESQVMHDIRRPNHGSFQNEYDSKILLEKMLKEPGKTYGAALGVAECVAKKAGTEADGMLGGPMTKDPNYDALAKALQGRKYNRCVGQAAAGVPMNIVNGALAEAMIETQKPALDERAKAVDVTKAEPFYTDAGGRTLDTVARCLAVYSPGLAMRVLDTQSGSPGEKSALADLYSKSPECGVSAAPSDFTVDEQRSAVAAGLYHWIHRG